MTILMQLIIKISIIKGLADQSVRDVREEIKKYGSHNPGKKFIDEMKARTEAIKQRQKQGLGGFLIGNRQSTPNNFTNKNNDF